MDRIRYLQTFAEVARSGSFAAAARHLKVSKATVTKHIAAFEKNLGARLLNRTTKQVRLTEAGAKVLKSAGNILSAYDELEMEVRDSVRNPKGVLHIGTPPAFGTHHLASLAISFVESHPDIQVVMNIDEGGANLVAQGLDLSIRIAPSIHDASYVALPLMRVPQVLVASPAYLDRYGHPAHPGELESRNCLVRPLKTPTGVWHFKGKRGNVSVRVRGSFSSNLSEALRLAALGGHGISMHTTFMVEEDIKAGRLVPVLPDYVPRMMEIFAIYSTRQNLPLKVRKFLDYLKAWAEHPPRWIW